MTTYQIYTRIKHFFTAKHWRGAMIHSPMMYQFVRDYAIKKRKNELIKAINTPVITEVKQLRASTITHVEQLNSHLDVPILILKEPFKNRAEQKLFTEWREKNHVVTAHFQGLIVIFFDKKLQKQHYIIRN